MFGKAQDPRWLCAVIHYFYNCFVIHFLGEIQSPEESTGLFPLTSLSFLSSPSKTAIPSQSILSKACADLDLPISLSNFSPLALVAACKFPSFLSLKRKDFFFVLERKRHHKHFCFIMYSHKEFLVCWARYNSWSFFPSLFNSEGG